MHTMAMAVFSLVPGAALAQAGPVDIQLDRCSLHWDASSGLTVAYDGRTILQGSTSPVVAYPPGWAWSYRSWGEGGLTARVEAAGERKVLRVECKDAKVPWTETVTAGPGDRFTVEYVFRQDAWDEPMNSEVCLCMPTTAWFVGSSFGASGPGGDVTGQIPLAFGGTAHPFGGATHMEFSTLFGKLTIDATKPLTLYDYAHRQHLWLGRDDAFPRNVEQTWSATLSLEREPLVVGRVRIEECKVPDRVVGERMQFEASLARAADGPARVTARLIAATGEPPATDAREVPLTERPTRVALSLPLPGPGDYPMHMELAAGDEVIYASPPFTVTVPRVLTIVPGRVPYMDEAQGRVLVTVAEEAGEGLRLTLDGPAGQLFSGAIAGRRSAVPIALAGLPPGRCELSATLHRGEERVGTASCVLLREPRRDNAVMVDNEGHGLLVNRLPFVPRAFYADIATVAKVIETEPVAGFNVIAPYLSSDIAERRKARDGIRTLLDRCAAVGMYVQLDIRTASHPPHTDEKWAWVQEEVEAFRDHPALLAYYLADEPELGWASPDDTREAYRRIKGWDPYHPVTMVFCVSDAAARYADAMDVVMTDPYPIPNGPVTAVVDFCERIRRDTRDALPLWIVPQAFGGGEGWRREPSRQEERVMTYLALIHGARGMQFFIRRPPIGNPTSPDLWNECRRLALEVGQLTPALASPEEAPSVRCSKPEVHVATFRDRGAVAVLAANVRNAPLPIELTLEAKADGVAEVLFENRTVEVSGGKWADFVDAFGTRAYRIQLDPPPADRAAIEPRNLIVNPSFEEAHNVGTPDGSYLGIGGDAAASWHVDPRLSVHGRQSLRLTTPTEGQGIHVNPFPIPLTPGKRYRLSVWGKGDREGLRFSLTLDAAQGDQAAHELTTEWQEYAVGFTASESAGARSGTSLRLVSAGTAWFDVLQVVPLD